MIYFVTALSFEAEPIIRRFSMKCIYGEGAYRIYESESGMLGISGTGEFNASTLVGLMCTLRKPDKQDVFVNFGICGAVSKSLQIGDFVRAEELVYGEERPLYLDLFVDVSATPIRMPTDAVDMEAYGATFSALKFFTCDRIFVFKVVSDIAENTAKNGGKIDKQLAVKLVNESSEKLFDCLGEIVRFYKENTEEAFAFSKEENEIIETISKNWKLSFQDKEILKVHFWKKKLLGEKIDVNCEEVKDRRQGEILLRKLVSS